MIGDRYRSSVAQKLLEMRALRKEHFPSELFDEYAWNILLFLFVRFVDNDVVEENDLLESAGMPVAVGRRWLSHLVQDGQVEKRRDGDDVVLSVTAVAAMRQFLDRQQAAAS